jgi:hypothetical protein
MALELGKFGDGRLQKGGPSCWKGWSFKVRPAFACGHWAGTVPASCVSVGSCATTG